MKKHVTSVALVLVSAVLGLAFGATRLAPTRQVRDDSFAQNIKRRTGEATPIREGAMKEKQAQHSRLYKGLGTANGGRKLRELRTESGDVEVAVPMPDVISPRSINVGLYLRKAACQADLVLLGTVSGKESQLTAEGTFIFTDYEVAAAEVFKNNDAAPVEPGAAVTVTRPGGAVEVDGRVLRAVDYRDEPLAVGGRYILFLKSIPETGAYRPLYDSRFEDSFLLRDGQVAQVSDKPAPLPSQRATAEAPFAAELRSLTSRPCDK